MPVWAGHFILPDPPSGLTTQAGDRRVLVLWNRNPFASTFVVQRATSPGGPFQQVNPKPVAYDIDTDLDGAPLVTPRPGFLDIGEWDPDGLPTIHEVAGVDVYGPDNGMTYWYQVASRDSLDRPVCGRQRCRRRRCAAWRRWPPTSSRSRPPPQPTGWSSRGAR